MARQSVIPAVKERLELYLDDESPRESRRLQLKRMEP